MPFISSLSTLVGQSVTLKGWLYNSRSSGSIAFLELRDGTGFVQVIVNKSSVVETVWQTIESLTQESSFSQ